MAKIIARIEPVSVHELAARARHNARGITPSNADPALTRYNKTLIGPADALSAVKADIEGCDYVRKTSDTVCAEMVLSFGREWLGLPPLTGGATVAEEYLADKRFQEWLKAVTEYLQKNHCLYAVLHMDEEGTPHVHAFTSVKAARKNTGKRNRSTKSDYVLNYSAYWGETDRAMGQLMRVAHNPKALAAKEAKLGIKYDPQKTRLGQWQTEVYDALKHLGLERGDGGSKKKHLSVHEYKERQREAKAMKDITAATNAKLKAAAEVRENAENERYEAQQYMDTAKFERAFAVEFEEMAAKENAAAESEYAAALQQHEEILKWYAKCDETFESVKKLASELLQIEDDGLGFSDFLREVKAKADEKFRHAVFEEARLFRESIDKALHGAMAVEKALAEYNTMLAQQKIGGGI